MSDSNSNGEPPVFPADPWPGAGEARYVPLEPRYGYPGPPPLPPPRYRLAAILFVLTFLTTTTMGGVLYLITRTDESTGLPPFLHSSTIREVWTSPELLRLGLSFSLPLLFILGCHELGHYFACRRYRVASTLPYFLPAPLVLGTFGAFIRIRGRIATKAQLFDIGIAGPLAGFVALLPFLVLGVAWSEPGVITVARDLSLADATLYRPGTNLALYLVTWIFHGRLSSHAVLDLHPFALAAWVGLFATAFNLLPMGQLDGGHLLYAATGRWYRRIAWPVWVLVCAMSVMWLGWLLLCLMVLVVMGMRHPPVVDADQPLDPRRRRLALVALVLLVLCFTPVPFSALLLESPPGVLVQAPAETVQRSSTNVTGPSFTSATRM